MAADAKPIARVLVTTEQFAEWQATWDKLELVTAQRDVLRTQLAAVAKSLGEILADVRHEGGYSTDEQQQRRRRAEIAKREAEAAIEEAGGKL